MILFYQLEMQEVEEFELPPPSLNYSEDVLKSAAINNLSIWRSHNGNQKRERFIRKFSTMPLFGQYNRKETESEEDQDDSDYEVDGDEDEDYEPPIFVSKNRNGNIRNQTQKETHGGMTRVLHFCFFPFLGHFSLFCYFFPHLFSFLYYICLF